MRARSALVVIGLAASALASVALAVNTSYWTHTSEADFNNGEFDKVVATNLGDLKLSRGIRTLLEQDSRVSAVYSLAEAPDGTIYAGTGPQGVLLKVKDGAVSDAAKLPDGTSLFALAFDKNGKLLIGTGGETGRILRLDKEGQEPTEIFKSDGVQYVWAIRVLDDGSIYAATGPNGQLFKVNENGEHEVLLDSKESNLLSLASDGKDLLFAGTDPNGLVYRVNRATGEVFIVYDAAETEISTLALSADGTLYAGTASDIEDEGEEAKGAATQTGRPEGGAGGMPLPTTPPEMPEPPPLPDPNPGEPPPIPQASEDAADLQDEAEDEGDADGDAEVAEGEADDADPDEDETADADEAPADRGLRGRAVSGADAAKEGNAIYRIDKSGFVTEIFRQPVLVLSIVEQDGALLVGTGNEGRVYHVHPGAEETIVLAKVDPKQVLSLLPTRDGRIVLGLANVGGLAAMTSGFAESGTFLSPVLDAAQISQFGRMRLSGSLPQGTTLKVATRSGNVADPDDGGWSKWTDDVDATAYLPITSPAARFLQYRLTLTSADGKTSPVVDEVSVAYQLPNLPPAVRSITIAPPEPEDPEAPKPQGSHIQDITWTAVDPNEDELKYTIQFRTGSRGPWVELKDDLTEAPYSWDTRLSADGRYEVKVIASDESANRPGQGRSGSRVSDPIVIDNTAPVIGDIELNVNGRSVEVQFTAADRTSTLAGLAYSIDASGDWQAVLPSDNISDAPEETVRFTLTDLAPGQHQITVRATDARDNAGLLTVPVTVAAD